MSHRNLITVFRVLFLLLISASISFGAPAFAGSDLISFEYEPNAFPLARQGAAAGIVTDPDDFKVVHIAAEDFADDVERVTGARPDIQSPMELPDKPFILLAGTIGHNRFIDQLVQSNRLDVLRIKGQWESFIITVVENPFPGIEAALVVAGSDRRGTAFGIYELSERIGVSPWYWWADVPAAHRDEIFVRKGERVFGPPSVKYRGIFINDEKFGLHPWASQTFEPETGYIGPKSYERIFELLLRLKANHIWPAMKQCTRAFNYFEQNKQLADDYAIVMGSSHCEHLLRNNIDEWPRDGDGPWDYTTNRDNVLAYWESRLRDNGKFENIYTLGMRGRDDTEMPGGGTLDEQTRRLEQIIRDQRELLARWVNPDITSVPQILSPYKEVLDLYRNGLDLPGDITILWTDDNYGYIRKLSTPAEQQRPGGSGVYYHISYSGSPHDYLWLNTTPPALIWEELRKAYDNGSRTVWVVNVGDIKPGEIGMEFFLQMAWDIDRWNIETVDAFIEEWAAREFGATHAAAIAGIMRGYYTLNYQRKPELMGFNERMPPNTQVRDPEFSLDNYGDEVQERLDAFADVTRRAEAVYAALPAPARDAYYQLVLYPVRCADLMNQKILYAFKSRKYVKQGRISANDYANKSTDAYQRILDETEYYNTVMSGGKWRGMMSHIHHDRPVFREIKTGGVPETDKAGMFVVIEGRDRPLSPMGKPDEAGPAVLPAFNKYTGRKHFIDIYNRGSKPFEWQAVADSDWIAIDQYSGVIEREQRLWVRVDFEKAPAGENIEGKIIFKGTGREYEVIVRAFNPEGPKIAHGVFVEENGVVAINAENFSFKENGNVTAWRILPGLGYTGASIAVLPFTMPYNNLELITGMTPNVAYPIHVFNGGSATIILQAVPTHEINEGHALACAVSVDDNPPVIMTFKQGNGEGDKTWENNVLTNAMYAKASIKIDNGPHIIKIYGIDPDIVLDRIYIDLGGMKPSYLGPDETRVIVGQN